MSEVLSEAKVNSKDVGSALLNKEYGRDGNRVADHELHRKTNSREKEIRVELETKQEALVDAILTFPLRVGTSESRVARRQGNAQH